MAFAGNLRTLPLSDIFSTLHNIRATGVLRLEATVGSRDVVFEDGEIVGVGFLDAEHSADLARRIALLGHPDGSIAAPGTAIARALEERQAAPAGQRQEVIRDQALSQIHNLFAWDNADFLFHAQGPDEPDVDLLLSCCASQPLRLNTPQVLMETARQQDEWAALRERIASEAMAMGLPLTVTNAPGVSSRVSGTVMRGGGTAAVAAAGTAGAADDGGWEWPSGDEPDQDVMARETQRIAANEGLRQAATRAFAKPQSAPEGTTAVVRKAGGDGAPEAVEPSTGTAELEALLGSESHGYVASDTHDAQLIGKTLGPYLVVAALGQGGMAMSYRAKHADGWKPVALKVVPRGRFGKQEAVAQAIREATAAASVRHPNVIACLSVGEAEGWIYIAFELVTGGDLRQEVARQGGRLTEAVALRCGLDCASGLAAIHQAGIIHRDLKPENVFIGAEGRAKLGDFGLAYAADADQNQALVAAGTPAFMAPEVVRGVDPDIRSDLYSLGATLFFMVTGEPPYSAPNTADLITAVLFGDQPDPRHLCPGLSAGFAAVVRKAMAKDRAKRYATADALMVDLQLLRVGGDPILDTMPAEVPIRPAAAEARSASRSDRTPAPRPAVTTEAHPASRSDRTPALRPVVAGRSEPPPPSRAVVIHHQPASGARPAMATPATPPSSQPSAPFPQPPARRSGWTPKAWHLAALALVFGSGVWVTALTLSWLASPTPEEPTVASDASVESEHHLVWVGDRLAPLHQVGNVAITAQGVTFADDAGLSGPATALNQLLVAAGDFSLEVELTAAMPERRGQGRILTLARSVAVRNLALSQSGSALEMRLRTTATEPTGLRPHLVTGPGVVTGRRQAVMFVRQQGRHLLYVDGALVASATVPGDLSTWDPGCELCLGQDPDGGASWRGTLHLLTVISRALTPAEVAARAGAAAGAH